MLVKCRLQDANGVAILLVQAGDGNVVLTRHGRALGRGDEVVRHLNVYFYRGTYLVPLYSFYLLFFYLKRLLFLIKSQTKTVFRYFIAIGFDYSLFDLVNFKKFRTKVAGLVVLVFGLLGWILYLSFG